jgi:phosphoribosylamine--glycine ligase
MLRMKSDLVDLCLAAMEDNGLAGKTAEWDPRASIGVVIAAGGYPASYNKGDVIFGLPNMEVMGEKVFHAGTKLNDKGAVTTNGGRVLCATALGNTVTEAQQRAYELTKKISWKDSFFRTDIGYRAVAREQNS